MMRRKLLTLFDVLWLPILIVVSTSWLYGPWLHHAHIGHLAVISVYEATGEPFASLFRTGDILGSVLILLVIWRTKLLRRNPWLGWVLIAVAGLAIVDDVFVIGCYHHCDIWALISHRVHDIESVVSLIIFWLATAIDAGRSKALFSRLLFLAQLIAGLLIITPLCSDQLRIFIQYIYQAVTIVWIAYVLHRAMPRRRHNLHRQHIRSVLAALVFLGGLLELLLALHVRAYGYPLGHFLLRGEPIWLAEHSVIVGVVMLYVSRHIYKGERRAAAIMAVVLATEVVKYSLLTPSAVLLIFGEILLLLLWMGWPAFDRNTGALPLASKLKSLGVLFAGVIAACALLIMIATTTGQGRDLVQDSQQLFSTSVQRLRSTTHENRLQHRLTHLRYISASLGVSLLALTLWSFFRPAGGEIDTTKPTRRDVEDLLQIYAVSSEDYFKLWPDDKQYFTLARVEGFIAYKKVASTVFALADPICAHHDRQQFLTAFAKFCRGHGWSMCFLVVEAESLSLYEHNQLNTLRIGSSAVVPIQKFVDYTLKDKWWRWQLNRAKRLGMRYEIARSPHSAALLAETAALSSLWLKRADHAEQGFALGFYNEPYLQECVLHLLRDEQGELVAFANQLPIYNGLRQTTVDLIRFRPDVSGAMPVLIANIIIGLQASSAFDTFDLGFVPLAKVENRVADFARRLAAGRFSAAGLEQFKDKFKPEWQPRYLVYDGDLIDLAALMARVQRALEVKA